MNRHQNSEKRGRAGTVKACERSTAARAPLHGTLACELSSAVEVAS